MNNDKEEIKLVVLSEKCPKCGGKVFGIAETREIAEKRLKFNLENHKNKPDHN